MRALLKFRYDSSTAGEFAMTRIRLGVRPSLVCTALSNCFALLVARSGLSAVIRDTIFDFLFNSLRFEAGMFRTDSSSYYKIRANQQKTSTNVKTPLKSREKHRIVYLL